MGTNNADIGNSCASDIWIGHSGAETNIRQNLGWKNFLLPWVSTSASKQLTVAIFL